MRQNMNKRTQTRNQKRDATIGAMFFPSRTNQKDKHSKK
jgi:hypothetical protein